MWRAEVERQCPSENSANGFKSMAGMGIFSHAPTAAYERSGPETEESPEADLRIHLCPCHRHCALERKLLVKAFGAGMTFAVIRRRMAIGCEPIQTP